MIGDAVPVRGYVTQDKYLAGRTLAQIEGLIGFHAGRLSRGARFIRLTRLPTQDEFELAAYSMTAQHRYAAPAGFDLGKLKGLARQGWNLAGPGRLIKVVPTTGHDATMSDDDQYPPGSGVPQWRIKGDTPIPGVVVAECATGRDVYAPVG